MNKRVASEKAGHVFCLDYCLKSNICVFLTPYNDCFFKAHFLHATNFLCKFFVLQMSSVINFNS